MNIKKFLMTFLSFMFMASHLRAYAVEMIWNFDASMTLSEDFHSVQGTWKILTTDDAPSLPNVLGQTAKSPGNEFNLVLIRNSNYQNLDFSAAMKAVDGEIDQGGGLVWRAKDADNYYMARYNPLESNYRVYKVQDGIRIQLQSANISPAQGGYQLRIHMKDQHLECYLNDKKYLEVDDLTFKDRGMIGLWTKADAQTYFDDLHASALDNK